jgi:putative transposase
MIDWPHAPVHRLESEGTYIVTAGTYRKECFFNSSERLQLVHDALLTLAGEFGWQLQAWAALANHYHFVAISPNSAASMREFLGKLHMTTAKELNRMDGMAGRRVWFQYWDSQITYERSYLARLQYVHTNPVHHGIVRVATEYPYCSARWFERTAVESFRKMVSSFKTDRIKVVDDFDLECGGTTPLWLRANECE